MPITRRDFLNGTALAIAAGLTPAAQLAAQTLAAQPSRYPPALTGLRGQHAGSFEVAHALAREHRRFSFDNVAAGEQYDLVIVGGGISGLAAAYFYRRAVPNARVLVLDNHDDFGGHAKRNEFTLDGRLIIGYGGSQSIQSPRTMWGAAAKRLLRDLHVDVTRFETAFDRGLYGSLGLSRGLFFNREAFGRDVLLAADPLWSGAGGARLNDLIDAFPLSEAGKAQLRALYTSTHDPLAGKSVREKAKLLKSTSYRDYLMKIMGCGEEVVNCFQNRTHAYFALGCDAVPAGDVEDFGYPGFQGLKLPGNGSRLGGEPYIYHFPDGNAAIARLLVRALIPEIAPGNTMEDIVLAPFDYAQLDSPSHDVRIRLNATAVEVHNARERATVGYVRDGALRRVESKHVVLACFHTIIPHLMPELRASQREALAQCVRAPLVYTNVVTRNWQPWINLKVNSIVAPMGFHSMVSLDFPVSLGGYSNPRDPAEPICIHLAHVPTAPNQGLSSRQQFRRGQAALFQMTFADFEDRIRDELDRMLGPGGFSSGRDIAAITVNRWPHGYSYTPNSLFDADDYEDEVVARARQKSGRVAIANSDSGGDAYAHIAIDQADRAVRELLG